ncbi:MAG: hypothetical protein P4M11_08600 [Candidatus Pacebacteria bacterium]|nr:hypothetical protein [Candidatus Paceibacterota bacterium]
MHYLISDNTGTIFAIDYNAGNKDAPSHKDYNFVYPPAWTRWSRPYGYVRIHGEILKRKNASEIKLELISNIVDHNEVTNHWLYVTTTRCIRKYGPLSEDELKSAETTDKPKYENINENERLVRSRR